MFVLFVFIREGTVSSELGIKTAFLVPTDTKVSSALVRGEELAFVCSAVKPPSLSQTQALGRKLSGRA